MYNQLLQDNQRKLVYKVKLKHLYIVYFFHIPIVTKYWKIMEVYVKTTANWTIFIFVVWRYWHYGMHCIPWLTILKVSSHHQGGADIFSFPFVKHWFDVYICYISVKIIVSATVKIYCNKRDEQKQNKDFNFYKRTYFNGGSSKIKVHHGI